MALLGPPLAAVDNLNLASNPPQSANQIYSATDETAMDTVITEASKLINGKPPMGLTENMSLTFLSSGNPCLDFFFHIVPNTPATDLIQRLQLAWTYDPSSTLKLIFNLRGVRGTGKSDKEGFYTAALWLHDHHPKTLAKNVRALADFGYLKDLPEILYRIHEGLDVRRNAKENWKNRKRGMKNSRRAKERSKKFKREDNEESEASEKEKKSVLETEAVCQGVDKETARKLRKERELNRARRALERYKSDPNYRFLYDCVCDVFAELLTLDMQHLSSGHVTKISLAAKWCPTIDSSYDKMTLLCEGIARRVFPRDYDSEYEKLEERHYVYRVRDRLRKQVLVPLHKALELPEVYMSANMWESLPYNRVASVAMKTYKKLFIMHDKERFDDYLEKVMSGKAKIAAGALLPHEIVGSLNDGDDGKVAELQWARIVKDLSKKGKLTNCIAVSDVSGSMCGIPMEVSVALGLLVSELSEEPWKGKLITFSEKPQLHVIEGDTLLSKTRFIREMECGFNTDFQRVFDRILEVAIEQKLTDDQMIKRIFVFSDMEFDEASGIYSRRWHQDQEQTNGDEEEMSKSENVSIEENSEEENPEEKIVDENKEVENTEDQENEVKIVGEEKTIEENNEEENMETEQFDPTKEWLTDYEVIWRKYREKGYTVPEIVFWNLRNSSSTPVVANQLGVALVSGFSKNLLTLFLEEGGIVNPEDVMGLAISGEEYKKLVVYD